MLRFVLRTHRTSPVRAAAVACAALALLTASCRDGPTEPPFELTLAIVPQTITGGDGHSCGLAVSGAAYCWGRGDVGQRGDGTNTGTVTAPVAVAGGLLFESIHAAGFRTFALTADGVAYAWGSNAGILGDGTTNTRYVPVRVAGGLTFRQLSAGYDHTVALTAAGVAYEWGFVDGGDPGDGSTTNLRKSPVPVAGGLTFRDIGAGSGYSVALTSAGEPYAWGRNTYGQLGDGTTTDHYAPRPVGGSLTAARLSVGHAHTVILTPSGTAYSWGLNGGALGDGTTAERHQPVAVTGGVVFQQITAGAGYTAALTPFGIAYTWGPNSFGNLGDGTTQTRTTPGIVLGALKFRSIHIGRNRTLAVTTSGGGYAWGFGGNGERGDGTRTLSQNTPVLILGGLSFR